MSSRQLQKGLSPYCRYKPTFSERISDALVNDYRGQHSAPNRLLKTAKLLNNVNTIRAVVALSLIGGIVYSWIRPDIGTADYSAPNEYANTPVMDISKLVIPEKIPKAVREHASAVFALQTNQGQGMAVRTRPNLAIYPEALIPKRPGGEGYCGSVELTGGEGRVSTDVTVRYKDLAITGMYEGSPMLPDSAVLPMPPQAPVPAESEVAYMITRAISESGQVSPPLFTPVVALGKLSVGDQSVGDQYVFMPLKNSSNGKVESFLQNPEANAHSRGAAIVGQDGSLLATTVHAKSIPTYDAELATDMRIRNEAANVTLVMAQSLGSETMLGAVSGLPSGSSQYLNPC